MILTDDRKIDRRALAKDLASAELDRATLAARVGELADALDLCIEALDAIASWEETRSLDCPGDAKIARDCLLEADLAPCTCKPTCVQPCKGTCGCEVCRAAYSDFLSVE